MKRKPVYIGLAAAAAVAGILAGCGHDHSSSGGMTSGPPPTMPPTSTAVSVTTSELLTQYAKQPSETGTPVPVNDGAFTITDTSDTATPVGVNGN